MTPDWINSYRRSAQLIREHVCEDQAPRLIETLCDEVESLTETLRDRFAMAALTGLLSQHCDEVRDEYEYGNGNGQMTPYWKRHESEQVADVAYEFADAMLAARQGHAGQGTRPACGTGDDAR